MNERMEEGRRRYEELMHSSPSFRFYMKSQERVPLKAFGREMDNETRYSLALMFKEDTDE